MGTHRVACLLSATAILLALGCAEEGAPAAASAPPSAAAAAASAAEAKPAGVVVSVSGGVVATRATQGAAERKLAVDGPIFADDSIATGPEGAISVRLNHNGAVWTLAANKKKRVDTSAAWRAPKGSKTQLLARRVKGELTASAGRHSENEAAGSAEAASRKAAEVDKKMVERVAAAEKARAPVAAPAKRRAAAAPAPRRAARAAPVAPPAAAPAPERDNVAAAAPAETGAAPASESPPAGEAYEDSPVASAPARLPVVPQPVEEPEEAPPLAVVKLNVKLVKGGLDKAVANKELKRRMSAVRACYEGALDKNPKLAGQVKVIVEVAADGSVSRVLVDDSGLGGVKVAKCIQSKLSKLRFPALPAEAGDKKRYIKATLNFSTR